MKIIKQHELRALNNLLARLRSSKQISRDEQEDLANDLGHLLVRVKSEADLNVLTSNIRNVIVSASLNAPQLQSDVVKMKAALEAVERKR